MWDDGKGSCPIKLAVQLGHFRGYSGGEWGREMVIMGCYRHGGSLMEAGIWGICMGTKHWIPSSIAIWTYEMLPNLGMGALSSIWWYQPPRTTSKAATAGGMEGDLLLVLLLLLKAHLNRGSGTCLLSSPLLLKACCFDRVSFVPSFQKNQLAAKC